MPQSTSASPDATDPKSVPQRTLSTGQTMPAIGLGTFSNDRYDARRMAEAVAEALRLGYRLIDCASVYGNEPEIGEVLDAAVRGGLKRDELFVTSKLWNDSHAPEKVRPAIEKSLRDLRLDYLDMYYIHWPFPNTHAPGAAHDSRSPDARPYSHDRYLAVYRELEKAVADGLIRGIGTSNMTVAKLRLLLPAVGIRPAANQMEMHPAFAQPEFFAYLRGEGICPVAYCPLGSPGRPDRDTTPDDVAVMRHPVVTEIARNLGIHPALVCLKWAVQRGQVPIPSSVMREQLATNLRCVTVDPLTDAEMRRMDGVDSGCRLIKGQVFLWETAGSWMDLWDEDGVIAT